MKALRRFFVRLTASITRGRDERRLREEIEEHLVQQTAENIRAGLSPEEARRQAVLKFGAVEAIKESHRDQRGLPFLEQFFQDIRYALRRLRKNPSFTTVAVLTLALGIGATSAIFSVVYGVLLKPLPFQEPDRLVMVGHTSPDGGRNHGQATYFTYRDHQRVFEDIGAWDRDQVTITGGGDPEQIDVLRISDATLPLLRVQPLLGRLFTKEDDSPGRPLRAILTYGYWQRRFGGAVNVIGQPVIVDGTPAEIVSVLPMSFKFPRSNDAVMLLPLQLDRARATGISFGFQVLARLKPGVTMSQANADLARMIPLLPRSFEGLKLQPNVRSQASYVIGDIGNILWILFGAVGVVLLIACANVANLFLVRAEGRQQDLAVRSALGASRGRLARVLLSESVLMGLAGGALGLVFAQTTIGLLPQLAPAQLPRLDEIGIDPMVVFFALAVALLTGPLLGLIAVGRIARVGAIPLKQSGRSASDSRERHRTRNTLVVAQIALALMLLVVSGLLIRTVVAMREVQPGFGRPEAVQTFRLSIPSSVVKDAQEMARTFERITRQLEQVPGVISVGLSSSITMDGENNRNFIAVEEFPVPKGSPTPLFRFKSFAPEYFETMGNRLVVGRSISWAEIYDRRPVILISETLALKYWKEPATALGKRVRTSTERPWREIVGVVGNERDDGLTQAPTPIVYWPLLNDSYQQRTLAFAVRSSRVSTSGFLHELQQAVWSVNSTLPLAAVQTLDEIQANSMAQTSFVMVMLTIAAVLALLLSVVGLYGVIAYVVARRTREIGIRLAIGAQRGDVRRLFLRHGVLLIGPGIAVGLAASLSTSRILSALLFGIASTDPLTYAAVSVGLAAVAMLACYLPARRAARVDPLVALRYE